MNKQGRRKSVLAIMLIIALLTSLISPIGFLGGYGAAYAAGTTHLFNSFDTYPATPSNVAPTAEIGEDWVLTGGTPGPDGVTRYLVSDSVNAYQGSSLKVVSEAGQGMIELSKNDIDVSGKIVFETYIMANNTTQERKWDIKSQDSLWRELFKMNASGSIYVLDQNVSTYEANVWYHVRAVIDQTADKVDVYINDAKVANGVALKKSNKWNYLNKVKMTLAASSVASAVYLDETKLTDYVAPVGITLSSASSTVEALESTSLTAVVSPVEAYQGVVWTTNNAEVATVDKHGVVTGVATGTAVITATSVDANIKSTFEIQVPGHAAGTTHFFNSFDTYPNTPSAVFPTAEIGGDWNLGVITPPIDGITRYLVSDPVNAYKGSSLKVVSGAGQGIIEVSKNNIDVQGKIVFETYIMANDTKHERKWDLKSQDAVWRELFKMNASGRIYVLDQNVSPYETNVWYHVRAVIDQTADKVDVYINDVKVANGVRIQKSSNKWNYLNTIKMTLGASSDENTVYLDETKLTDYVAPVGITISSASPTVEALESISLTAVVSPVEAFQGVVWTTNNAGVATVDKHGVVTGVYTGTAVITATSVDANVKSTFEIQVPAGPYAAVTSVSLPDKMKVSVNGKVKLQPTIAPENATDKSLIWTTSDPDIAVVDANGLVTGVAVGTDLDEDDVVVGNTVITATNVDSGEFASTTITVYEITQEDFQFEAMMLKRKEMLDGGPGLDPQDPDMTRKLLELNLEAQSYWGLMNKEPTRSRLWDDIPESASNSDHIHTNIIRLRAMTYAFSTKGGDLYNHPELLTDIIDALDWIGVNQYSTTKNEYGNWWNFKIGVPMKLADIYIMLNKYLTKQQIDAFIAAADSYIASIGSDAFNTETKYNGANRTDVLLYNVAAAVMQRDQERMQLIATEIPKLFVYTTDKGDGFYQDGSFLFHQTVAYTGSYGGTLLNGLSQLLYLLAGSPWEVTDPKVEIVYKWIDESYVPIIYRGRAMDMVNGRTIVRGPNVAHTNAVLILSGILRMAESTSGPEQKRLKAILKHWIAEDLDYNNIYSTLGVQLISSFKQIMNDPEIEALGDEPAFFDFPVMARTVYRGSDFAFTVSKSSKRVSTYALTNKENGKGWYTGDGMTYLYDADKEHYAGDYWATVNYYRLPGTTVDTRTRTFNHDQNGDGEGVPSNVWAGGVELGLYGSSGMQLIQKGSTLVAKKSWFMIDDAVLALGSGITSNGDHTVETIIEQRKLNAAGDNAFTVDGDDKSTTLGWSEQIEGAKWAFLEGITPGVGIGYAFPGGANFTSQRIQQQGRWSDNNKSIPVSELITDNYLSMIIDHGVKPDHQAYSYIVLPNRSENEVEQYSDEIPFVILENSDKAHAIKHNGENITAVNFWNGAHTVRTLDDRNIITTNKSAAVIMQETKDDVLTLAVSDPTLTNKGTIELEIDRSAAVVLAHDQNIVVSQISPTIKIIVNLEQTVGQSFTASFVLLPDKETVERMFDLPPIDNDRATAPSVIKPAWIYSMFENDGTGDEVTGNAPFSWNVAGTQKALVTVEQLPGEQSRFMRLLDYDNAGHIAAFNSFHPQSGLMEATWTFAEPFGSQNTQFELGNENAEPSIILSSQDGFLNWHDSLGDVHRIATVEAAKWIEVRLAIDIARNKYNIYMDGQLVAAGVPFTASSVALDTIRFKTDDTEDQAALYLDNIVVSAYGAQSIIDESFNNDTVNGSPAGWSLTTTESSASVKIVEELFVSNRSVKLRDNNNKSLASMEKKFAKQTGIVVAEWDFKDSAAGKTPFYDLKLGSVSAVKIVTSADFRYMHSTNPGISLREEIPSNVWHHVRLVVDIPRQKVSVALNGEIIGEELVFYSMVDGVDGISFSTSWSAVDTDLYIDNVKIYSLTNPIPVEGLHMEEANEILYMDTEENDSVNFGTYVEPVNAAFPEVEWLSSRPTVAKVDSSGQVTALSPGKAVITATTAYSEFQQYVTVYVVPPAPEVTVNDENNTVTEMSEILEYSLDDGVYVLYDSVTFGQLNLTGNHTLAVRAAANPVTEAPSGKTTLLHFTADPEPEPTPEPESTQNQGSIDNDTDLSVTEVSEEQLRSGNGTEAVEIRVSETNKVIVLPHKAGEWLGNSLLIIESDALSIAISAATLDELTSRIAPDVEAAIHFTSAAIDTADAKVLLDAAMNRYKANLQAYSEVIEFGLKLVSNDGEEFVADKFAEPVRAVFEVPASAYPSLTSVYLIDDNGELHYIESRIVDGQLTALITEPGQYVVLEYNKTYVDVSSEHWASDSIARLTARGIINGVSDDSFAPQQSVSRAEFTAMLVRILGLTGEAAESSFSDISSEEWYAQSVTSAVQAGIVSGVSPAEFKPRAPISRQEMAAMAVRALQFTGYPMISEESLSSFTDTAASPDWAKQAIHLAKALGLVSGRTEEKYYPLDNVSRAESSMILDNLIQALSSL